MEKITFIMVIHARHQNKGIIVPTQWSLSTVKTIRYEMENCNGDYEAVAVRKDCVAPQKFAEESVGRLLNQNSGSITWIEYFSLYHNIYTQWVYSLINTQASQMPNVHRKSTWRLSDKCEENSGQSETYRWSTNKLILFGEKNFFQDQKHNRRVTNDWLRFLGWFSDVCPLRVVPYFFQRISS